jgi:hypothetical protein
LENVHIISFEILEKIFQEYWNLGEYFTIFEEHEYFLKKYEDFGKKFRLL